MSWTFQLQRTNAQRKSVSVIPHSRETEPKVINTFRSLCSSLLEINIAEGVRTHVRTSIYSARKIRFLLCLVSVMVARE